VTGAQPLVLSFSLTCDPGHAFKVFTERTSSWWPAGHSRSGAPEAVTIEPRVGGRIYERAGSGEEHNWGEVLDWDPPARLGYLWHIYGPREQATKVEISFAPDDDGTCVTVNHSGFERLGAEGEELRRRNQQGWRGLMEPYISACSA